jgi:hypothetical protein
MAIHGNWGPGYVLIFSQTHMVVLIFAMLLYQLWYALQSFSSVLYDCLTFLNKDS